MGQACSQEKDAPVVEMISDNLEMGYWDIRGLGAPCRMCLTFSGKQFVDNSDAYSLLGSVGNITGNSWATAKPKLQEKNALANLPHIINGDTMVVQSVACLIYLQKLVMSPISNDDYCKVMEMTCQVHDLRNDIMTCWYDKPFGLTSPEMWQKDAKAIVQAHIDGNMTPHYDKIENRIAQTGGPYSIGNTITVCDFYLWEMIESHEMFASDLGIPSPVAKYRNLKMLYEKLKNEPKLRKYFLSSAYLTYPVNNKIAHWGQYVPDWTKYPWTGNK